MKKKKRKKKTGIRVRRIKFYVCKVTKNKKVVDVFVSTNYDAIIEEGMNSANEVGGRWVVFNSNGYELDGSL